MDHHHLMVANRLKLQLGPAMQKSPLKSPLKSIINAKNLNQNSPLQSGIIISYKLGIWKAVACSCRLPPVQSRTFKRIRSSIHRLLQQVRRIINNRHQPGTTRHQTWLPTPQLQRNSSNLFYQVRLEAPNPPYYRSQRLTLSSAPGTFLTISLTHLALWQQALKRKTILRNKGPWNECLFIKVRFQPI